MSFRRVSRHFVFAALLCLALSVALGGGAMAEGGGTGDGTLHVPDEYATIGAAMAAADPGDTIIVGAGVYPEKVVVNKAGITIEGDGSYPQVKPALSTASQYDTVITVQAANVTIRGLDISNALGVVDTGGAGGTDIEHHAIWDGAWTLGAAGLTVDDCRIHDIEHGVRSYGPNLTVTNCEMYSLRRSGVHASGPYQNQPLPMTVRNNWFHDWHDYYKEGAAVHVKYDSRVGEVAYNYMSGMRMGIAYYYGGPKASYGQQIVFHHNTIDLDYDPGSGPVETTMGISLYGTGPNADDIVIRDNIFANARWYGIYQEGATIAGSITVDNNLFYSNNWYYWPEYQYPYQWFGDDTVAQAGWTGGETGFTFTNNITAQDPLFALTGVAPEQQWSLTCGSPAYHTASDGTNIGAWQGTVVCDDQGPVTSNVVATPNPVSVGGTINLTANVDDTDTGGSKVASAEYSLDAEAWMAMAAQDGAFDAVSEDVQASFTAPGVAGVYENLCVRGTDEPGNTGAEECIMLVVYDPEGGFVTGGGWIDSPEGAYMLDPSLTGKASFGFVSKYQKGATVPTGNTEFVFSTAGLSFHSTSYDWLVVTGSNYAKFKGSGTINGMGDYKFMLWAGDGDPDTFRIRIWTEDEFGVETDIYDNGFDQAIGGGSIVIHAK